VGEVIEFASSDATVDLVVAGVTGFTSFVFGKFSGRFFLPESDGRYRSDVVCGGVGTLPTALLCWKFAHRGTARTPNRHE
jgi:hypothetical protein